MRNSVSKHTEKNLSFLDQIRNRLLFWLRLTDKPVIRVYNSYGNNLNVTIIGHVLRFGPMPRRHYRKFFLPNMLAVFRLFMVKPWKGATVKTEWEGITYFTTTESDGFYKLEFTPENPVAPGWHKIKVVIDDENSGYGMGHGELYIPYRYQYAFISDIDDTFLISHSSKLRRRLYVLFTKHARSRRPFEGVVNHYKLLSENNAIKGTYNPFFYVSSSEWNLYDFIVEFSFSNGLPKGVFLLNQLKTLTQVFLTGQNKHSTKFFRIVRLIEAFPQQQYVLFGDDSQEDPSIYASIVEHFPGKVFAIYIRHVHHSHKNEVNIILDRILNNGVACCYFTHSSEAIIHSKKIGLINTNT
ncbi:MAG: App1 family protein [Ginsengibacter sp.]